MSLADTSAHSAPSAAACPQGVGKANAITATARKLAVLVYRGHVSQLIL